MLNDGSGQREVRIEGWGSFNRKMSPVRQPRVSHAMSKSKASIVMSMALERS